MVSFWFVFSLVLWSQVKTWSRFIQFTEQMLLSENTASVLMQKRLIQYLCLVVRYGKKQ